MPIRPTLLNFDEACQEYPVRPNDLRRAVIDKKVRTFWDDVSHYFEHSALHEYCTEHCPTYGCRAL